MMDPKINEKYKETPIGKIPVDWEVVRLGDKNLFEITMGSSPPSSTYNSKKIGIPFLQGNAEFGPIYPSPIKYCSSPQKITDEGNILVSVRAPVGDINLADQEYCIGRGVASIQPKNDFFNSNFLFYFLKFNKIRFERASLGSTFKAIRREEVDNFKVIKPNIIEQQKIAEILGTVDEAIEKVDKAIEKTERLKKGLMQELLTKGIGHKEFKDTKIGRIPKEWGLKKLKDISAKITDGSHYSPKEDKEGNNRIATVANIENNQIDIGSCKKINEKDYRRLVKNGCKPELGDVLFSKDGTIGLTFSFNQDIDLVVLSSIAIIRPEENLNSEFCSYVLRSSKVFSQIIGSKRGTGLRRIILQDLKRVKIPFPPLPEQQKIAEILSTVDKKIDMEKKRKEKLEKIKKGLMQGLLTGKRRVKV